MNKIKVIVRDKTVLELGEDAKKGDIIDLKELTQVDTSYIESVIESNKDEVYKAKLHDYKAKLDAENQLSLNKLQSQIDQLNKEKDLALKLKEQEIEKKYSDQIKDLKNSSAMELQKQKSSDALALEKKNGELNELRSKIENEKNLEISKIKEDNLKLMQAKENEINELKRAKGALNVKQTGEDLEAWCDREVISYMQNGLTNCTWIKDNEVVRDEGEQKGSKADYIFRVYADDKHDETEEIASICLDMKDENPNSTNKQNNAHYYKKLNENRIKKNCGYAVLVSNLEADKSNDIPIYKASGYENMYVVRPAYLMTFLNMLASLATRYCKLITSKESETIALKNKIDLIKEFNDIKNTYLDKPLAALETNIESIAESADKIKKCSNDINEKCEKIRSSYIKGIEEKISKFELNLNKKVVKQLEDN